MQQQKSWMLNFIWNVISHKLILGLLYFTFNLLHVFIYVSMYVFTYFLMYVWMYTYEFTCVCIHLFIFLLKLVAVFQSTKAGQIKVNHKNWTNKCESYNIIFVYI